MKVLAPLAMLLVMLALWRHRVTQPAQAAIVAIGDSITAGVHGSEPPWPAVLSGIIHQPVLNRGISGNGVKARLGGRPLIDRFARDVLAVRGVQTVIILEGINDIWNGPPDGHGVAAGVIAGLERVVAQARGARVRVLCGTLLPFGAHEAWTPGREEARVTINAWIRAPDHCDGLIDTAAALADPIDSTNLLSDYDGGDGLHPNRLGEEAIAHAVAAVLRGK